MPAPFPQFRTRLLAACYPGLLLLAGCRSTAFPDYPRDYREYAYVANAGEDTLTVLDLVHVRQQATIRIGSHPQALLASPVRNEVYAVGQALSGAGSLAIVDAETNQVATRLSLGRMPSALAINPQGDRLYIANRGSNSISIVDLRARRSLGVAGVGEDPDDLAITSDGAALVVANRASGSISILNLPTAGLPTLRSTFAGCPGAGSIAILPDASKAFVACSAGHQVMVIALLAPPCNRGHSQTAAAADSDRLLTGLDVGSTPVRLVRKPDGGEIFVLNQASDSISEIATGTNEVGGATLIGGRPAFGIISADNSLLWVANGSADTIAVYSIDDGKLINTVHIGGGPGPVAFSADGHLLLAADTRSGDISLLRTFSRNLHREPVYGSLFTLLPAGKDPVSIVDKAFRLTH